MLGHPFEETFALASDYRARIIRRLYAALENEGEAVIDAIAEDLNEIVCRPKESSGLSYVSFFVPSPFTDPARRHNLEPFVIRVAQKENDVGLRLWEAGELFFIDSFSRL